MHFVDTHCHLYLPEFKNDLKAVLSRAQSAGIEKFYLPAIDYGMMNDLLALAKAYPGKFFAMAGLHPCSVSANYNQELNQIENLFTKNTFTAIGETGLDFYWSTEFKAEQYQAFERQMNMALQYKLPIVIHTRNAMQETIKFVRPFAAKGLTGIFHCFGDTYEYAKQIIDINFFLGIGGVLTFNKSGLDEVVRKIGLKHIVLETDAPYLAPVPFRGKRNESSYIKFIAEKMAEVKNISIDEVAAVTTANAKEIFNN